MAENALFFIHEPQGFIVSEGTADEIDSNSSMFTSGMRNVCKSMVKTYSAKTGLSDERIMEMLRGEVDAKGDPIDDETKRTKGLWLTAAEAKEHGFVDEIAEEMDMAACAKFVPVLVKAGVKNIPDALNQKAEITPKMLERALRDAGCSRAQAKAILVHGLRDADGEPGEAGLRDAEPPEPEDDVARLISRAALLRMGKEA